VLTASFFFPPAPGAMCNEDKGLRPPLKCQQLTRSAKAHQINFFPLTPVARVSCEGKKVPPQLRRAALQNALQTCIDSSQTERFKLDYFLL
jgi:hypothetical protein